MPGGGSSIRAACPGRACRVIGCAGRSRQTRRCCRPRRLISESACRERGIDGDLGCVEAESAQSTARISRCARWMHPEGVAAAAPWPAASSPQTRAQPAVHRHRQQQRRRQRGRSTCWSPVQGRVDHRRLSDPAAAKKPDRVTNNMSTGICADAVSQRPPPGRSQIQRAYHAPLRPSGVTWRA